MTDTTVDPNAAATAEPGAVGDTTTAAPQQDVQTQQPQQQTQQTQQQVPDYTDFSVPEGVELDQSLLDSFKPLAKELGLKQEQAQKLVDLHTQVAQKNAEAQTANWEKLQDSWIEATQNDQEFGGEKLEENVAVARKALDAFGNDALKEFMDYSGAGNHPEVIRFLFKVGQAIGDDQIHVGSGAHGAQDPAKVLFPDMN